MKIKGMLFIIFAACVGHIGAIDVPKSLPATIKAAEILRIAWPKQINEGRKHGFKDQVLYKENVEINCCM